MNWEIPSKMDDRHLMRRSSSGFTLIEVTVALVITSLLVSILVSALYYMFRVQDALRDEVVTRESDLRVKAWFADAVASCLPGDINTGTPFIGSETEIKCETTSALQPTFSGAPSLIVFALKNDQGGRTVLTYQEPARRSAEPHILAEWASAEASFRYVNTMGTETDRWPKDRNDPETLPRLVKLSVTSSDGKSIVWPVAIRNDPWIEQMPKNPFGIITRR